MRDLVLKRIEELGKLHNGFDRNLMRWRGFYIYEVHISNFRFELLDDEELLGVFEEIIGAHIRQM